VAAVVLTGPAPEPPQAHEPPAWDRTGAGASSRDQSDRLRHNGSFRRIGSLFRSPFPERTMRAGLVVLFLNIVLTQRFSASSTRAPRSPAAAAVLSPKRQLAAM